jgi:hypothetical protein
VSQTVDPVLSADADLLSDDIADEGDLHFVGFDSSSTLHDRFQFESKFDFIVDAETEERPKTYQVDIYFFIPRSMGVTSDTFPRDRFFAGLTHYLRVQTPELSWREATAVETWSIPVADRYFEVHLETLKRQRLAPLVTQEVRLFGCLIYSQYKLLQVDLLRVTRRGSRRARERFRDKLENELAALGALIDKYRERYVRRVRRDPLLLDDDVKRAFLLVDEYISYRRESALIKLRRMLEKDGALDSSDLEAVLSSTLAAEVAYRREQQSHAFYDRGDLGDSKTVEAALRETHYYRLGLLKKYVSEVLFLQMTTVRKDKLYKNLIGAFGAALAATWATLAQLQTAQMMVNGRGDNSLRLMVVLLLGIVAYVFKDRIKELTKEYFNEKMKHRIPDFEQIFHYNHIDETGRTVRDSVGSSREYLRYLGREALPPEVAYMREVGHRAEIEPERKETIIHYCKKMRFDLDTFRNGLRNVRRVHDVVRFDVSEFLNKLSDPKKMLSYYEPDKGIVTLEAPKVYHLNVVYRYSVWSREEDEEEPKRLELEMERIRLILNKKGIVRIEEVVPRGEIGYTEQAS